MGLWKERERERETSSYQSLMGVHSFAQVLLRTQVFARTLSLALSVFFFTYVSKQIHSHASGVGDAEYLMLTTALGTTVPRYIHSDAKVHMHIYTYVYLCTYNANPKKRIFCFKSIQRRQRQRQRQRQRRGQRALCNTIQVKTVAVAPPLTILLNRQPP